MTKEVEQKSLNQSEIKAKILRLAKDRDKVPVGHSSRPSYFAKMAYLFIQLGEYKAAQGVLRKGIQETKPDHSLYHVLKKHLNALEANQLKQHEYDLASRKSVEDGMSRVQFTPMLLPFELLMIVFSGLTLLDYCRMYGINREWKRFFDSQPRLWSNLDFTGCKKKLSMKQLKWFANKAKAYVTNIRIVNGLQLTDKMADFFSHQRLNNLNTLVIHGSKDLGVSFFRRIFSESKISLVHLEISPKQFTVSDALFHTLLEHGQGLKTLKIDSSGGGFKQLVETSAQFSSLQLLQLQGFHASKTALSGLFKKTPKLKTLRLDISTDSLLHCLSDLQSSPLLEEVDIDYSELNSLPMASVHEFLSTIAPKTLQMKAFQFRRFYGWDDVSLEIMGRSWKNLEVLSLQSCRNVTESGLGSIFSSCTQIQTVHLVQCPSISKEGFINLAKKFSQNWQVLDTSRNTAVSDDMLLSLSQYATRLRQFDVSGCAGVSGLGLIPLIKSRKDILEKVGLDSMHHLRSEVLAEIRRILS